MYGPSWVDNWWRKKRRRVWDIYEDNILWPWFLFKRKWPRNYFKNKILSYRLIIKIYIKNIPHNLNYRKALWKYRFKYIYLNLKLDKSEIIVIGSRILSYIYLGFWAFALIIKAILITIEIIIVPEPISLKVRLWIKDIKRIIKNYFKKKGW